MGKPLEKLDYTAEYKEIQPSLFRESEVLDRLLQTIFSVCDKQQEDLLWVSQNLLNIDAAEKSQLDFIGNIVGQPRFLSDFNTEPYFGYDGSYQSKTFGSSTNPAFGGYWNSRSHFNTATSRKLNDDEYRRLIKARVIYNQSNCTANDLLEVINLITNSKNNTVQMLKHGLVQINSDDNTGILSYFVDRLLMMDSILPIAAGVRVGLETVTRDSEVVVDKAMLYDSRTRQEMAFLPELRVTDSYDTALNAYEIWATELGVSPTISLSGLGNQDDNAFTVDIGFSPLLGGVSTKVAMSTEGGFGIYREGVTIDNYSNSFQLVAPTNTANLSTINRYYLNSTVLPALMIMAKSPNLDSKNRNSKWQKSEDTAIFYTEYSYYSSGSTQDTVKVALKLKAGGHIEVVVSEANTSNSKLQFMTFDESSTSNLITLDSGGYGVNIPLNTCLVYSTEEMPVRKPSYTPFEFDVTTTASTDSSRKLSMEFYEFDSTYFIYKNNELIASDTLPNPEVVVTDYIGYTTIELANSEISSTVNYKLYVTADAANLTSSGVVDGVIETLNYHSFCDNIAKYTFNISEFSFTVPTYLPMHVTNLDNMFNSPRFNQDLSMWSTRQVTSMVATFSNCTSFNGSVNSWDTTYVSDMNNMFYNCVGFNQRLDSWIVSGVRNMEAMFGGCTLFNQDISAWNVGNVVAMNNMFENAINFNQDLSNWCVPSFLIEPPQFSLNTTAWVLPRPVWGDCPARSIHYRNTKIITNNPNSTDGSEYKFTIDMGLYSNDWRVFDTNTGEMLAANYFGSVEGITINRWGYSNSSFSITFNRTGVATEQHLTLGLATRMSRFTLNGASNEENPTVPYPDGRSIEIVEFSTAYNGYDITTKEATLILPPTIPANVLGFRGMLMDCYDIQGDITGWDTSTVTDMDYMFAVADNTKTNNFNQDLSGWCVTNITSLPIGFALNANNYVLPRPIWGTCPATDLPPPETVQRIQVEYSIGNLGARNPEWDSSQENLEAFVAANRISTYVEEWGDAAHQALFARVLTRLEEVYLSYEPYGLSISTPDLVLTSGILFNIDGVNYDTWSYAEHGLATGRPTRLNVGRTGYRSTLDPSHIAYNHSLMIYMEIWVQDSYVTIPNPAL